MTLMHRVESPAKTCDALHVWNEGRPPHRMGLMRWAGFLKFKARRGSESRPPERPLEKEGAFCRADAEQGHRDL
jgi:hypothetical protein